MKDGEPKSERKVVRKVFNLERGTNIESLFAITQYDPDNLRRLWLLAQYQFYSRTETTFSDAVTSLKDTFRRSNRVTATYWSPPTRKQVLGRRRENKIREFIEFWEAESHSGGVNIFDYALTTDLTDLIFGNAQFPGIIGSQVKLNSEEWGELLTSSRQQKSASIAISLPYEIDRRLAASKNPDSNYAPEPIPF